MSCELSRELSAYLDEELEEGAVHRVREHLRGCDACRRRLDALRGVGAALREVPEPPAPLAPRPIGAWHAGGMSRAGRSGRLGLLAVAAAVAVALAALTARRPIPDPVPRVSDPEAAIDCGLPSGSCVVEMPCASSETCGADSAWMGLEAQPGRLLP
jgi:anti-sigma factor RsiW